MLTEWRRTSFPDFIFNLHQRNVKIENYQYKITGRKYSICSKIGYENAELNFQVLTY